ncbi:4Fe-4S binding protein [Coriobacteriia bacterium Es71-Z0120]|uniref:4Fe-4S dicluster domain-containing protein n=1 Tax=Parvivirga hydrogeniphila TaxID=2939460 RepID=UPI002260D6D3|nr:4Fe-4S dicluster domain-containing protein [Parvivirga hydrogeniphila]MCL4078213.1 4Fe-4S binding protein [Parvivirga hydrogeniphila]
MCEFCHKHGDGQKWYLAAASYAADLQSDLERRGYLVEFVSGFDERMRRTVPLLERLRVLPKPLGDAVRTASSRRMQRDHFGQPVTLEDCAAILDIATSVVRVPCVCRHFARTPDDGVCLAITTRPTDDVIEEAFAGHLSEPDTPGLQRLSRAEALALLSRCEEQGLMHSVWTFKTPFIAGICNCSLQAGCMAMRSTLELGVKVMWKGERIARLDADACTGCGACAQRCPFVALSLDRARRVAVLDAARCYGCGLCAGTCRPKAIGLVDRSSVPAFANDW